MSLRLFLAGKIVLDQPGQLKTISQKNNKNRKENISVLLFYAFIAQMIFLLGVYVSISVYILNVNPL